MDPKGLKIGNFVKTRYGVGEVVAMESVEHVYIEIKTIKKIILGKFLDLDIEPILLTRDVLITCCSFDKAGRLKLDIDNRLFYLKENNGHIILQDSDFIPLIHFWNVVCLHQVQNMYYIFKGQNLAISLVKIDEYYSKLSVLGANIKS
ncbi:MAG TPA: hypothetical protein VN721_01690 [Flavipsychrobacter sp.]|nr:hypothetical protein [Flavipsychrobacter sp.]